MFLIILAPLYGILSLSSLYNYRKKLLLDHISKKCVNSNLSLYLFCRNTYKQLDTLLGNLKQMRTMQWPVMKM